jgi:hypothetical protein
MKTTIIPCYPKIRYNQDIIRLLQNIFPSKNTLVLYVLYVHPFRFLFFSHNKHINIIILPIFAQPYPLEIWQKGIWQKYLNPRNL